MDKMKMQDVLLMQASGYTTSTINDQSTVMGSTRTTNGTSSQGTTGQGANRPSRQGLQIHKRGTIYIQSYAQTNKHMYDWILLYTCTLIECALSKHYVIPCN